MPTGSSTFKLVKEIVFANAGGRRGPSAECLAKNIFTQGDNWDELHANVREAVEAFYFDRPKPANVCLHLVRDEVFAGMRIPRDERTPVPRLGLSCRRRAWLSPRTRP